MSTYSSDRRSVLKIFGAIGATCAYPFASGELFGQTDPAHHHNAIPPQAAGQFLNAADSRLVSRIADLIIPATDTPGAVAAGVPVYIDSVISSNTDQQLLFADGLRWIDSEAMRTDGKKFIDVSSDRQLSILQPLCDAADGPNPQGRNVEFFALMKRLTADGYYTSKIGLMDELGYQGNAVRPGYPECVHEH